jgi:hypothetical protein
MKFAPSGSVQIAAPAGRASPGPGTASQAAKLIRERRNRGRGLASVARFGQGVRLDLARRVSSRRSLDVGAPELAALGVNVHGPGLCFRSVLTERGT